MCVFERKADGNRELDIGLKDIAVIIQKNAGHAGKPLTIQARVQDKTGKDAKGCDPNGLGDYDFAVGFENREME